MRKILTAHEYWGKTEEKLFLHTAFEIENDLQINLLYL